MKKESAKGTSKKVLSSQNKKSLGLNAGKNSVGGKRNFSPKAKNVLKSETELPVNIWVDEGGTYLKGGHAKRIKFQTDTNDRIKKGNFCTMDLDGVLQNDLPSKCKLTTSQIDQIKNFVFNNKYVLSMLADSKILVKDVSSIWIKGGKKVSADTIKSLNDKIDELCKKDGSKK